MVSKLTVCVYPMATVMPGVTAITGLDNYNLADQPVFDAATVRLLNTFLARLPAPACLVAHNGDRYDFPLLRAEVARAGAGLQPGLLCADSWVAAREILQQREAARKEAAVKEEMLSVTKLVEAGEFDDDFTIEDFNYSNVTTDTDESSMKRKMNEDTDTEDIFKKARIIHTENETTPARNRNKDEESTKSAPVLHGKVSSQPSVAQYFKSRKRLDFTAPPPAGPASLSLVSLHRWLLGAAPRVSHGAEADCLALLRVTAALGRDWVQWAGQRAVPLDTVAPMWGHQHSTNM